TSFASSEGSFEEGEPNGYHYASAHQLKQAFAEIVRNLIQERAALDAIECSPFRAIEWEGERRHSHKETADNRARSAPHRRRTPAGSVVEGRGPDRREQRRRRRAFGWRGEQECREVRRDADGVRGGWC